jgi:hypothetical protein
LDWAVVAAAETVVEVEQESDELPETAEAEGFEDAAVALERVLE